LGAEPQVLAAGPRPNTASRPDGWRPPPAAADPGNPGRADRRVPPPGVHATVARRGARAGTPVMASDAVRAGRGVPAGARRPPADRRPASRSGLPTQPGARAEAPRPAGTPAWLRRPAPRS